MAAQGEAQNPHGDFPSWPYQYFRLHLGRDKPDEARNVLLVVATLITAVTFQAGVNPPGVWQDDSSINGNAGESILPFYNSTLFSIFLFCNTVALCASVGLISCLLKGFPFYMEVTIALCSMMLTYGTSIIALCSMKKPRGSVGVFIPAALLPTLLRLIAQMKHKYCLEKKTTQLVSA